MRVLVADDDPAYRSLLMDLLSGWRFDVDSVSDGKQALAAMRQDRPPRLVILDYEMPGLDGFEVAASIRAEEAGAGTYVLMITGSHNKDELMRVLVSGADDYLIKPFDPMDLQIHLRAATRILHLQDELDMLKCVR